MSEIAQEEKRVVAPMINVKHNEDDTGLEIRVDLAGASKESVDLDVGDKGFCIKAEGEDFRYENCQRLAHEVKREEAKAKFNSGLLNISVPFKDTLHGHKVTIEQYITNFNLKSQPQGAYEWDFDYKWINLTDNKQ